MKPTSKDAACKAVQDAEEIAENKTGQNDPHHGQEERLLPVRLIQDYDDHKIGQSQLCSRYPEIYRDQHLHIAQDQGQRGKYSKICCSVSQFIRCPLFR